MLLLFWLMENTKKKKKIWIHHPYRMMMINEKKFHMILYRNDSFDGNHKTPSQRFSICRRIFFFLLLFPYGVNCVTDWLTYWLAGWLDKNLEKKTWRVLGINFFQLFFLLLLLFSSFFFLFCLMFFVVVVVVAVRQAGKKYSNNKIMTILRRNIYLSI